MHKISCQQQNPISLSISLKSPVKPHILLLYLNFCLSRTVTCPFSLLLAHFDCCLVFGFVFALLLPLPPQPLNILPFCWASLCVFVTVENSSSFVVAVAAVRVRLVLFLHLPAFYWRVRVCVSMRSYACVCARPTDHWTLNIAHKFYCKMRLQSSNNN